MIHKSVSIAGRGLSAFSSIARRSFSQRSLLRAAAPSGPESSSSNNSNLVNQISHWQRMNALKDGLRGDGRLAVSVSQFNALCSKLLSGSPEADSLNTHEILHKLHENGDVVILKNGAQPELVVLRPDVLAQRCMSMLAESRAADAASVTSESASFIGDEMKHLRDTVEHLYEKVLPQRAKKAILDEAARQTTNKWLYGGLAYFTVQTGLLAELTWVSYGWDVVEPICAFLGFSVSIGAFFYFSVFQSEYTFEDASGRITRMARLRQYRKHSFDLKQYRQLEEEYEQSRRCLQQKCWEVYGFENIPAALQKTLHPERATVKSSTPAGETKAE